MYLVIGTRPDLAYTVTMLSQFSSDPSTTHMAALKRVLRFLKYTQHQKLHYSYNQGPELVLDGYSDADFAGDKTDRKSTSGYILKLSGSTIC